MTVEGYQATTKIKLKFASLFLKNDIFVKSIACGDGKSITETTFENVYQQIPMMRLTDNISKRILGFHYEAIERLYLTDA